VYQGQVEITARGDELIAVVGMQIETAVATIVASEMPQDAPLEGLKAQAVVTRSFLSAGPRHEDYDFCDTTHCQYMRSPAEVSSRVWAAARATQGVILTWRDKPIAALYSSRCAGMTRSLRQAGIDPGDGYPFYSVDCPWCRTHPLQHLQQNSGERRRWGTLTGSDSHGVPTPANNDQTAVGHAIGMCQHGAAGMALSGADFRSILAHYYPNAEMGTVR
jgi:SpoIID/LytB domain protein